MTRQWACARAASRTGLLLVDRSPLEEGREAVEADHELGRPRDVRKDSSEPLPTFVRRDVAAVDAHEARPRQEGNRPGRSPARQLGHDGGFADPAFPTQQDMMALSAVKDAGHGIEEPLVVRFVVEGVLGKRLCSSGPIGQVLGGRELRRQEEGPVPDRRVASGENRSDVTRVDGLGHGVTERTCGAANVERCQDMPLRFGQRRQTQMQE
jgi:hypothetical protein